MKHILILVDKITFLLDRLGKVSGRTYNQAHFDERKIRKFLKLLDEYVELLDTLVTSHKDKKYMDKLHSLYIREVDDWTNHVSDVFKKLHNFSLIIKEDLVKLHVALEKQPDQFHDVLGTLAMGVLMTGLSEEEGAMKHLREAAMFTIEDLDKLIHNKTHLAGIHKWIGFLDKDVAHQVMARELYFAELIGK